MAHDSAVESLVIGFIQPRHRFFPDHPFNPVPGMACPPDDIMPVSYQIPPILDLDGSSIARVHIKRNVALLAAGKSCDEPNNIVERVHAFLL